MSAQTIRLKKLLRERHWQKYATFCREYDRVAKSIDAELVGTAPSRGQLHRWLAGELKGLPYPDHCRILEGLFPGWTAAGLFESVADDDLPISDATDVGQLIRAVSEAFQTPDSHRAEWTPEASNGQPHRAVTLDGAIGSVGQEIPDSMQRITKKLVALARVLRLSPDETARIASLAGQVVELTMQVDLAIEEGGHGTVRYEHDLFNMSNQAVSRIPREVWFEHTPNPITIMPISTGGRKVLIQRIHDTPGMAKFACQISPPIQPGETGTVAYEVTGGRFVSDHYWRQSLPRYTRHVTITLRHIAVGRLLSFSALEEQVNGSEQSVSEDLIWDNEGTDVLVTLTRNYLRPGQSVTVRWDVEHIERSN
ncbi:hypothetical protein AB0G00_05345 [Nocardia salmonicida]|uniref:hypothetical protein n=1 Tax=Nocardia salmonicida TaxID=53431 RepID=UPI0033F2ADD4